MPPTMNPPSLPPRHPNGADMADESLKKVCFLITGVPRSGTSSVSQMLENLGVYFGDPAHFLDTSVHKHNPVFYELQWVNDFNDRVLGAIGATYFDDLFPIESDFESDAVRSLDPVLAGQFRGEFGDRPVVGVKDPRLCFTLPVWRRVLAAAGYDVKVVLAMRNAAAVIKSNSLLRDDPAHQWFRFYARHLLCINYFTRDMALCRFDYDLLMCKPTTYGPQKAEELGLEMPDAARATRHLSREHYHHQPDGSGTGHPWVDRIDSEFRAGRLDPEQYLECRRVASLFSSDARGLKDELVRLEAGLKQNREDIERRQRRLDSLTAERDDLSARHVELERRCAALTRQLEELQARRLVRLMHLLDRAAGRVGRGRSEPAAP